MNITTQPDTEIAQRFLEGEEASFEIILERYETTVFRLACVLTDSEATAEEILGEVFAKLYIQLKCEPEEIEIPFWIYKTTFEEVDKRKLEKLN